MQGQVGAQGDAATLESIRKAIWGGQVPIQFTLTSNEVAAMVPPEPFYVTYLHLHIEPVREYFAGFAPSTAGELWFEVNGQPLKWHVLIAESSGKLIFGRHYPVGVLFDLLAGQQLPWAITVHFHGFPSAQLVRCPNADAVKSVFMNSLKEANYLKHGDGSKTNALSIEDQADLWEGVRSNKPATYWKANGKLVMQVASKDDKSNLHQHVPVRVLRPGQPPVQEPIAPLDATGEHRTLGAVLNALLPAAFPSAAAMPTNSTVLVQGITPPFDSSMAWLAEHFSHPDNFLYIIVLPAQP